MKAVNYPTLEEALYLHEELIRLFGGTSGIRDPGLLESVLHRPRSVYYQTLSLQAAALMQSLALNHCFVDGNKRIAFALTATFLRVNGWKLVVNPDEGENFLIKNLIQEKFDIEKIAIWIESHLENRANASQI